MKLPESICESQQLSKVIKDKKKLSMKQLIMVITLQRYIERKPQVLLRTDQNLGN